VDAESCVEALHESSIQKDNEGWIERYRAVVVLHDAATVDVHSEVAGEKVERGREDWTAPHQDLTRTRQLARLPLPVSSGVAGAGRSIARSKLVRPLGDRLAPHPSSSPIVMLLLT